MNLTPTLTYPLVKKLLLNVNPLSIRVFDKSSIIASSCSLSDFGSSNSSSSSSSSSADTKFGGSSNKVTLDAGDYKDIIEAASKKYGISADIIAAVMQAESSGDAKAYNSKSKATGLMQIIPDTAKFIAEKQGRSSYDLYDPETNIDMSTWYMRYLIDTYKYNKAPTEQGKYADMLAAYNWGPGNYEKSGLHGNVEAGDYEKLNSETKVTISLM